MKLKNLMLLCCITVTGFAYAQNNSGNNKAAFIKKHPLISAKGGTAISHEKNKGEAVLRPKEVPGSNSAPGDKKTASDRAANVKFQKPVSNVKPAALTK